jgi:predicted transposase YdaD
MSTQLSNIHDAFFKHALGDPGLAGTFLREHLPPELAQLLGPEPPEPMPGTFVDEDLRQHHTDLLFRVRLKAGGRALAYVLMEHKSAPDETARLQLFRYIARVLTQWYDQNGTLPLPPVLSLLVHQGPPAWGHSPEFTALFDEVSQPLLPYLPSFRHALVDLEPLEDQSLSDQVRLRAYLKALKYARRTDLPDRLSVVLAEAPALDEKDLFVILTYLNKGPIMIDSKLMHETLKHFVPEQGEQFLGWFSQPYYDKGKAEGKAEGAALLLIHLIEKRFGAVPPSDRERILAADLASIETWCERVLEAPDLPSVFAPN